MGSLTLAVNYNSRDLAAVLPFFTGAIGTLDSDGYGRKGIIAAGGTVPTLVMTDEGDIRLDDALWTAGKPIDRATRALVPVSHYEINGATVESPSEDVLLLAAFATPIADPSGPPTTSVELEMITAPTPEIAKGVAQQVPAFIAPRFAEQWLDPAFSYDEVKHLLHRIDRRAH